MIRIFLCHEFLRGFAAQTAAMNIIKMPQVTISRHRRCFTELL
uniref:Uncharacterized protein n=1 Tax=Arundo donax TaxID=35708 RepID=A0A0A9FN45_ARUDO